MKEQTWKRKEYDTWDEAFRALAPVIRQQSVRVASYAQVLFVQACASSYGTKTADGAERMNGKYAELDIIAMCIDALARNIGKIELKSIQRKKDSVTITDTTSDVARVLKKPNPYMTSYDFPTGGRGRGCRPRSGTL